MTPIEVLFAVRGLIASPDSWCKGNLAQNKDGEKVGCRHPHARKFSLDGAFVRVVFICKCPIHEAYELCKTLLVRGGYVPLAHFNDAGGTTHSAVLALVDKAIMSLGGMPPPLELEE